jgi:glutathione S-transferase
VRSSTHGEWQRGLPSEAESAEAASEDRYVVYGRLDARESVSLASVLRAKGIAAELVEESPSLSLALAARAGCERGPYLRTPEGFVLGGLHAILDWLERMHPVPALMPPVRRPVRRACVRLLEDWIELWLPGWPRSSWGPLEELGRHLFAAGFLLGREPTRPDHLLAAWLETEVLVRDHARAHLARHAPRLVSLGSDLLEARHGVVADDAIALSLLPVLEDVSGDYHAYLRANHAALKGGRSRVMLDLGLGARAFPRRRTCEVRRIELGRELAALSPQDRRDVRSVLEPVGAWDVLTLPPAIAEIDPADPRSL